MSRQRNRTFGYALALLTLLGAAAAAPVTVHAAEIGRPATAPAGAGGRRVTLPTGERAFLDGGVVRAVEPARATISTDPARVHTMAVGGHFYIVPEEALPFVGRQLDLSLFDVLAPPAALQVRWAPGATAHDIAGLDLDRAAGGRSTGRIGDPAAFGAALAGSAGANGKARAAAGGKTRAGALAGVEKVLAEGAAEPPVEPHFPVATLTVKGLDKLGAPAFAGSVSVTNAEDVQRFSSLQSFVDGQVSFSVPVGHYSLEVSITTYDEDGTYRGDALLIYPELEVTGTETTVTADAARATAAVPVPATPEPSGLEQLQATYSRLSAAGSDSTTAIMMIGGSPALSVTPTAPVSIGDLRWYTYFRLTSPAAAARPYLYDLVFPAEGEVPADFAERVPASGLAALDATYAAEGDTARISTYRTSFQPWEQFPIRFASSAVAPLHRTEYVSALTGVGWVGSAVARPAETNGIAQSPMVEYRPGQRTTDRYFAAPAVPGVDRSTLRDAPCPACRQGDRLLLELQPRTDAGGHAVRLVPSDTAKVNNELRVYADGALVDGPAVPAGTERLRLELDSSASASWSTTADRVRTAWDFPTAPPTGSLPAGRTCAAPCAFLPLVFADYDLPVDATNTVPAGVPAPLTVTLRRQAYDPAAVPARLTLDVSADDGATWQPVTATAAGGGRFTATVTPVAGYLSLRVHADDPAGASFDQTVLRAVRVAG